MTMELKIGTGLGTGPVKKDGMHYGYPNACHESSNKKPDLWMTLIPDYTASYFCTRLRAKASLSFGDDIHQTVQNKTPSYLQARAWILSSLSFIGASTFSLKKDKSFILKLYLWPKKHNCSPQVR